MGIEWLTARRDEVLRKHRISSVVGWMSRNPNKSYPDLAKSLGVVPAELVNWQFQESAEANIVPWAYIDSFVRLVRVKLVSGWGGDDDDAKRDRAICFATWKMYTRIGLGLLGNTTSADAFWDAITQLVPSSDWVPQGVDDDIVMKAAKETFGRKS